MKKLFLQKILFGLILLAGLFLPTGISAQQQITVSGSVFDTKGEPIIGANIVQQSNGGNGTESDMNGKFRIVTEKGTVLKIFSMGYKTKTVAITGPGTLKIILSEDSELLNQVVVIGYGTIKKKDLTGSIGSVNSGSIKESPVVNLGQAIQGKVSGVLVNDSGAPGSDVSIKIRGLGTINNSNPLVVIDGVPTDLSLSALDINTIARVDILKDASATAIYGSRGANGVVLVTTKQGSRSNAKISVSADWRIQNATNVPDMLDASQYAAYSNDMLLNAGMTPNPNWSDPSSIEKGTDWLDAMLRTGSVQNYSLSVSGGDDKKTYYLSGSMLDQKGIVLKTSYRRFSFQSNINLQLKPWLKLSNNLTLSIDNKKSGDWSISDAMFALPVQSIKDPDGKWSGPDGSSLWYGDIRNPVGTATINHNTTKGYNLLTNVSAEITLVKWLKFKSTFGYDAKFWFYNNFTPAYDWKPIAVSESSRYEGSNKSFTYLWDNYFTFDKDFGRHHVDVMAGTSAQNNKYDYFDATKNGYLFDNVSQFNNGSDIKSVDGDVSEWSILSFMARANYTYDDKYLFTTTIRRDGSSRFGSGNKYGLFPSFSGAWRISRESWFKNEFPFINDMKIRVGYGVTGNQEIGNYTFASTYNTGVYVFNGTEVKALSSVTMANPDIHWEEVRQTNIGLDFSLLKNRIAFSVDAYNKKTCDMLVKAAIPITSGYEDVTTTYVNAGKVRNRGIEMSVASTNISNGNFSWKTTVNATYNKNKILDLNSDTPLYQNQYNNSYITIQKVGAPINAFYGYVTDGIFQTKEEVERHALQVGGGTAAGDIKFKDLDNNGIINENDRTIIGNPNPDWIFSIGNTLIYKNFDFSIFLLGVTGNDIYNVNAITSEGMSSATNQTTAVIGRWKGKGTSNSMPRAVYADPNQNCRASDRFIEDGSYLRIKNITLGYKLPEKLTARLRMNTVRINVSCENLATITGYSGFDPEVGVNGIDSNRYPLSRTFSFGININF